MVLDSWKSGESPEAWKQKNPAVVVQDLDWLRGSELKGFEIVDGGEAIDANLHCRVRLQLADSDGGPTDRTVTYLVSTSPKLTVFRKIMP